MKLSKRSKIHLLDGLGLLIGRRVDRGCFREVFEYIPDPKYVVKFEADGHPRSNILEHQIYFDTYGLAINRFLAPCLAISEDGRWLVQRRVMPDHQYLEKKRPKKVPRVFNWDVKVDNWGWLLPEKRWVCCDYANSRLFYHEKNLNLVEANWW